MKKETTQPKCALDGEIIEVPNIEIDENSSIGLSIADYIKKHLKLDKEGIGGNIYISLGWETKTKYKIIDCIAII